MTRVLLISAAAFCMASMAPGIASLMAQGPLPGDVLVTRTLQSLLGEAPTWAAFSGRTAESPAVWLTLCLAIALAIVRTGWRGALLPLLALLGAYALNALLRALIFVPRPNSELVAVAGASASSSLPSTFALVYGAIFGAVIFASNQRGAISTAAAVFAAGLIVAGTSARVVLGGHWISQVLASLLLAFSLVIALQLALRLVPWGQPFPEHR